DDVDVSPARPISAGRHWLDILYVAPRMQRSSGDWRPSFESTPIPRPLNDHRAARHWLCQRRKGQATALSCRIFWRRGRNPAMLAEGNIEVRGAASEALLADE